MGSPHYGYVHDVTDKHAFVTDHRKVDSELVPIHDVVDKYTHNQFRKRYSSSFEKMLESSPGNSLHNALVDRGWKKYSTIDNHVAYRHSQHPMEVIDVKDKNDPKSEWTHHKNVNMPMRKTEGEGHANLIKRLDKIADNSLFDMKLKALAKRDREEKRLRKKNG